MCPCVGAFLHSPVPSGYCGKAGSDENTIHTCLQGALEAKPLTVVAGGGARPDGCVTRDSQLLSGQYPPTGRPGWVPSYRSKSPESWVRAGSISSALLPYGPGTFSLEGSSSQARGARTGAGTGQGPSCQCQQGWSSPHLGARLGFTQLCPSKLHTLLHQWTLPWWEFVPQRKNGWRRKNGSTWLKLKYALGRV